MVLAAAMIGFMPQSRAATFTLDSGQEIDGEVIHATRSALMIRAADGAVLQLSLSEIDEVKIKLQSGEVVAGALKGWSKKVYAVVSEGRLLKIQQARLVAEEALEQAEPEQTAVAAPAAEQPSDRGEAPRQETTAPEPEPEPEPAEPRSDLVTTIEIPAVAETEAEPEATQAAPDLLKPLENELAQTKADLQTAQAALADSQKLNEKLVEILEVRAMEAARLRDELGVAKQTIEMQQAALSKTETEVDLLNDKLSAMTGERQELEAALKTAEETKLATEQTLTQAEADILGLLDDTEAYRTRTASFRVKLEESASVLEKVQQMLQKSETEKQKLRGELEQARNDVESLTSNLVTMEAERARETAEAADLAEQLIRAKQAIEELRSVAEAPAAQN